MGDIDKEREEYIERSKKVNVGPMGDYTTSTYAMAEGVGKHGAMYSGSAKEKPWVSPIPLSALIALVIGIGLILGVVIAIFS
jgi:hypothetical protein